MKIRIIFYLILSLIGITKSSSQPMSVQICLKYFKFDRYPNKIYNLEDINKEFYIQDDMCKNSLHLDSQNYKWFIDTIRLSPNDPIIDSDDMFARIMLMLMLEDQARSSMKSTDLKLSDFFQIPLKIGSGKYTNFTNYGMNGSIVYFQKSIINVDFPLSNISIEVLKTKIPGLLKYKVKYRKRELFEFLISGFYSETPLLKLVELKPK